jgi:hypothetical protein
MKKWDKNVILHYVMRVSKFLIEKYFDFLKMDKKNVQNEKPKIFYAKSLS